MEKRLRGVKYKNEIRSKNVFYINCLKRQKEIKNKITQEGNKDVYQQKVFIG